MRAKCSVHRLARFCARLQGTQMNTPKHRLTALCVAVALAMGMDEVLARRIGEDELAAIASARALATGKGPAQPNGELLVNVGNDGRAVPFHGYYFRGPAGDKIAAYPAEYRVSGVLTFIAGPDSVVYEKDLGPDTTEAVTAMRNSDSTASWRRIE
jgi:Protein of unknown function (DUF2950)